MGSALLANGGRTGWVEGDGVARGYFVEMVGWGAGLGGDGLDGCWGQLCSWTPGHSFSRPAGALFLSSSLLLLGQQA